MSNLPIDGKGDTQMTNAFPEKVVLRCRSEPLETFNFEVYDVADGQLIMKRSLMIAGYQNVIFAKNGEERLKVAGEKNPDLVITDTKLPGIDGFEVCRRIKSLSNGIPKVIVMTGHVDAVEAVKARQSGADEYCVKTRDTGILIETIKKVL